MPRYSDIAVCVLVSVPGNGIPKNGFGRTRTDDGRMKLLLMVMESPKFRGGPLLTVTVKLPLLPLKVGEPT
jgi:hypothetical protein